MYSSDYMSNEDRFNGWYYRNLIGGNTSPYSAYIAATKVGKNKALESFCKACCPKKFKDDKCTCKKICSKYEDFIYLMNR